MAAHAASAMGSGASERAARGAAFGLDCGDGFVWDGGEWAPGGEFVKRLRVTNVTTKTLHFTYRVPRAKVFFMAFPTDIVLSAGNSVFLEVSFRPIARVAYDDTLEVVVGETGSFFVPVVARLPRLAVAAPSDLDFTAVPVNEVTELLLPLLNSGQVDAAFHCRLPAPFSVSPQSGVLAAGRSTTLTVAIRPNMAAVLRGTIDVVLNEGSQTVSVPLRAIAKYQHIATADAAVDFGETVYTGIGAEPLRRSVVVRNMGPVRATLSVSSSDTGIAHQMALSPATQAVAAGAEAVFTLSYSPHAAGVHACEHFTISTPGGNSLEVTARGQAEGPRVTVARKERPGAPPGSNKRPLSVQFGDLKVGEATSTTVVLANASRVPAIFEFVGGDAAGIFIVAEPRGTVPPQLTKQVVLRFAPLVAGNFYRRVVILVRHAQPLYLDVMGTAYDDKKRPFPMRQRHIDAYRLRSDDAKLSPPETVLEAVKASGIDGVTTPAQRAAEAEWQLTNVRSRSGDRPRSSNAVFREVFQRAVDDSAAPIALSHEYVDFGGASRVRLPEKQTVTIINRSAIKMAVQWVVPPSTASGPAPAGGAGAGAAAAAAADDGGTAPVGSYPGFISTAVKDFAVVPDAADIEPGSSVDFKVAFRPSADSHYYCQELEAVVAPKVNRSFRLVDEESFTPPVSLALRAMGHTFRDVATFAPKLATSFGGTAPEQTLVLPPCALGDEVYYTFGVSNDSDVAASYEFPSDRSGVLTFHPRLGVVPLRSFALVTARFRPLHARAYAIPLDLRVNGSMAAGFRVHVVATGSSPRLALPDGALAFLKPTGVGTSTTRTITLRNPSRVPLTFRWRVVGAHVTPSSATPTTGRTARAAATTDPTPAIVVSPAEGDIEGNDAVTVTVACAPARPGSVTADLACAAYFIRGSEVDAGMLVDRLAARAAALATAPAGATSGGDIGAGTSMLSLADGGAGAMAAPTVAVAGLGDAAGDLVLHAAHEPVHTLRLTAATEALAGAVAFVKPTLDCGAVIVDSTHAPALVVGGAGGARDTAVAAAGAAAGVTAVPITVCNRTDGSLPFAVDAVVQIAVSSVEADADVIGRLLAEAAGWNGGVIGDATARTAAAAAEVEAAYAAAGGLGIVGSGGAVTATTGQRYYRTLTLSVRAQAAAAAAVGRPPLVAFEPHTGTLPPRSSQQIMMKIAPTIAAVHRIRIYATLLDEDGAGTNALASAASRSAAIAAAVAAERDTRDPAFVDWDAEPSNTNDAWCDVVVAAAHPAMHVEDARQLHSREALLALFPYHMAGLHNRFMAPAEADRGGMAAQTARQLGDVGVDGLPLPPVAAALGIIPPGTAGAGTVAAAVPPAPPGATTMTAIASARAVAASAGDKAAVAADIAHALGVPAAPRDVWLRGDFFNPDALLLRGGAAAAKPVDVDWGGWAFDSPVARPSAPWDLWRQFSLADLNHAWATRLTAAEAGYNAAPPARRDKRTLHHVVWEFTPAVLDTPPMVVLMQLRNSGPVPATLDFLLEHELDVEEVEPWVDMPEPDTNTATLVELTRRRVMDIQPRSLRLQPGEAGLLRLHYAYAALSSHGAHELPVVAQLRGGKAIRLTLRGITLPHAAPCLWMPSPLGLVQLASVAVGTRDPPAQHVTLMNPTAHAVAYAVDADSMHALHTAQHGFRVFYLDNPRGVLPPQSTSTLRLKFVPLEAKEYEVRLRLAYGAATASPLSGGSPRLLLLAGGSMEAPTDGDMPGDGSGDGGEGPTWEVEGSLDIRVLARGYLPRGSSGDGATAGAVAAAGGTAALVMMPDTLLEAVGVPPPQLPPSQQYRPQRVQRRSSGGDVVRPAQHPTVPRPGDPPVHPPSLFTLATAASWSGAAANAALADAVYKLAGVDATTAAVATYFNPLDVLTALAVSGGAGGTRGGAGGIATSLLRHLVVAGDAAAAGGAESTAGAAKAILFSGTDAAEGARALAQYLRAVDTAADVVASEESEEAATWDATMGSSRPVTGETATTGGGGGGSSARQPRKSRAARSRRPRPSTVQPAPLDAAPAASSVFLSLAARLQQLRLYSAIARPDAQPPAYHGARPPVSRFVPSPHLDLPEGLASLSYEWLDFGDVPTQRVVHRVVILRNNRADGGGSNDTRLIAPAATSAVAFAWDATHPLVQQGVLRIHPATGEIPAGDAVIVRITATAPIAPIVLQSDVTLRVWVPEAEYRGRCEATLTALIRQRDALRRAKHRAKPGSDRAHVSVAEKTTASRAMHLQEVAYTSTVKAVKAAATAAKRVDTAATATSALPVPAVQRLHAATRPGVLSAAGAAIASATGAGHARAVGVPLLAAAPGDVRDASATVSAMQARMVATTDSLAGMTGTGVGIGAGVAGGGSIASLSSGAMGSGSPSFTGEAAEARAGTAGGVAAPQPSLTSVPSLTGLIAGGGTLADAPSSRHGGSSGSGGAMDGAHLLAGLLAGDLGVDESPILLDDDDETGTGRGGSSVRANIDLLPLPPPPSATLFLHVTLRAMTLAEFVAEYSHAHLAAFLDANPAASSGVAHPAGAAALPSSFAAAAPPAEGAAASPTALAAAQDVVCALLAELLAEQDTVASALASGSPAAQPSSAFEPGASFDGVTTFAAMVTRPEPPRSSLLALAFAGEARVTDGDATADGDGAARRLGRQVYDPHLPPRRAGDADFTQHAAAAAALHGSVECRDFVARMLESTVLQLAREALAAPLDVHFAAEAAGAGGASASGDGAQGSEAAWKARMAFLSDLRDDEDGSGHASEWAGVLGANLSDAELDERLARADPEYRVLGETDDA